MSIYRRILYTSYKIGKKIGYIDRKNSSDNYVSIITFHRVNDYDSSSLTLPRKIFDELMEEISKNYKPISLQDLIKKIRDGKELDKKTVVITFDDGYKDNILCAAPILLKYNIPATFFITSGYINTEKVFPWDRQSNVKHPSMTWNEVRELVSMGFDIGAHTINHANLGMVSLDIARTEIMGCKEQIENEINKEVNTFAYPFGGRDNVKDDVIELIRKAGFDCCCSAFGGKVTMDSDLYNLYRIATYPTVIETLMEVDNFMTYFDGKMKLNIFNFP